MFDFTLITAFLTASLGLITGIVEAILALLGGGA